MICWNRREKWKSKVQLHLSGTPYRILMGNEFTRRGYHQPIASLQTSYEASQKWDEGKTLTQGRSENPYTLVPDGGQICL